MQEDSRSEFDCKRTECRKNELARFYDRGEASEATK